MTIGYITSSGQSGSVDLTSSIADDYDVEIVSANDTIQWCRFAAMTLTANSSSVIHWSPSPAFDPGTGSSVTVRPFASGWYYASVGSEECGDVDSVYIDLAIANITPDTIYYCKGSPGVTINGQLLGLAKPPFTWTPTDSLSSTIILSPIANPEFTTTYILSTTFNGCVASDTVVVRVDSLPQDLHIDVAPLKPYYCAGEIVALFSPTFDSLKFPDLTFAWKPYNITFLTDSTFLNAALQLLDTTLYIRDNKNNACISHDSILLNVIPPSVPISVTDTTLCPGHSFKVEVLSTAHLTDPEWTPSEGLSCTKCLIPQ